MNWNELNGDNLPPFEVPILTYGEKGGVLPDVFLATGLTKKGVDFDFRTTNPVNMGPFDRKITHWMLLPEPPTKPHK